MTPTDELRRAFRFHHANGGHSVPPGRAACALHAARVERALRRLLDAGAATIELRDDDSPWDADVPWNGPVYGLIVTIGDQDESLWGIGTPESDAMTFGADALPASSPFGDTGLGGYLRVCAVELADQAGALDAAAALDRPARASMRLSPEPAAFLLTIRTPSHDYDWQDPTSRPHELVQWLRFDSMRAVLEYMTREETFTSYGQTWAIESLYPDDPRLFIDWDAVNAAT